MKIRVKYHDGEIQKLRQTDIGNWIDLRSRINIDAKAGDVWRIPLGVSIELPEGYEAIIAPRSSSFKNYGFIQTNSIGVVDESFKGDEDEWLLPVIFVVDGHIKKGDRVCQFRVLPRMGMVNFTEVSTLGNKNRGGLGSTGKN